jgi:DNA-binding NarL/FixJ family response regulator
MPRRKTLEIWRPALFGPDEWRELVDCSGLSPRQAQIVSLVMQSRKDKEIISALDISHSTVRTHLEEAKERLEAHDRVGLAYRLFWRFREAVEPKQYQWPHRRSR